MKFAFEFLKQKFLSWTLYIYCDKIAKMKFTCSVEIDLPVEKVVELFDNPKNLIEWQDGFVAIEPISGAPGEPGSKSRMIYIIRDREMEIIETIKVKNLPTEMTGVYEHIHMVNTMTTRFKEIAPGKTKYEAEIEYTQFNGFVPKMMAFFMPGLFKKQTQKWLNQFKTFAERTANVK
jgi:hypothetical protein